VSVTLSGREIARLESVASTLLTPLEHADFDLWRASVNRALRELLDGDGALFALSPVPAGSHPGYSDEYFLGTASEYRDAWARDGGRKRALERRLEVCNQTLVVANDWAGYRKDVNVNEFLIPNGIRDGAGLVIDGPVAGSGAHLMVGRNRYGTPGLGSKGLVLLRLLLPAFRASVFARLYLGQALEGLIHVLDSLPNGALITDADGATLHESPSLSRILSEDGEQPAIRLALRECVFALVARLRRPRACDEPLSIHRAAPDVTREFHTAASQYSIWGCYLSGTLFGRPAIMVSLARRFDTAIDDAELAARYLLTARELRVAHLLAAGRSNKEIAMALGVSSHTARRHTEHVLLKLGVHSRARVGAMIAALRERGSASTRRGPR
jgi:DNA-binding CsgD family transcriptional regulator